jgi:GNAT superfamily N-acetyltransferase
VTIRTHAVDKTPPDFTDWIPEITSEERLVVAYYNDIPAGLIRLTARAPEAEVTFHFVQPELRDLGIGEQLLEEAIAVAKKAGCSAFYGWVSPGDRVAKLTYEAQGFRSDKIRVRRDVEL